MQKYKGVNNVFHILTGEIRSICSQYYNTQKSIKKMITLPTIMYGQCTIL